MQVQSEGLLFQINIIFVPCNPRETNYEVRNCGMELEHEYVFRVTAYNAGGESETSDPSEPITAMERFVKPRLDKDLIGKEREMHAGTMLRSTHLLLVLSSKTNTVLVQVRHRVRGGAPRQADLVPP